MKPTKDIGPNAHKWTARIRKSLAKLPAGTIPDRELCALLWLAERGVRIPCKYWKYARDVVPLRELIAPQLAELGFHRRRYGGAKRRRVARDRRPEAAKKRRTQRYAKRVLSVLPE